MEKIKGLVTIGLWTLVTACEKAEIVTPGHHLQSVWAVSDPGKGIILATHTRINGDSVFIPRSNPIPVHVIPAPIHPTGELMVVPEIEVKN